MNSTNLLQVEDAKKYGCFVQHYTIGHSRLIVKVQHENNRESFNVEFAHVLCFSGLMRWNDAFLRFGSDEEYLHFIRQMAPSVNKSDEELLDSINYGRLYIFEGGENQIRLVATDFSVADQP